MGLAKSFRIFYLECLLYPICLVIAIRQYREIFINFFNFLGTQQLVEAIEKEKSESKKRIKTLESGVAEEMSNNKKELIGKIETVEADIKKKQLKNWNQYTKFKFEPYHHIYRCK